MECATGVGGCVSEERGRGAAEGLVAGMDSVGQIGLKLRHRGRWRTNGTKGKCAPVGPDRRLGAHGGTSQELGVSVWCGRPDVACRLTSLFASSAATGRSPSTTSWKCSASVDRWPTGASRPASIAGSSSGSTWCAPSRPCSARLGPGSGTPGSGWSRRSSRRARSITGSPAPRRHSSWRRRPASIRWSPTASCGSSSGSRAGRSPARRWASTPTDRRPFTAPTWRSSARSSRSRWRSSSRPKAPQRLLRLIRAWRRASWVEEVRYYCAPGAARRAVERAVRSARAEERVRILQAVSR